MHRLKDFLERKEKICIVGLGYVGLPLAILFSKKFSVAGYDINPRRIRELKEGYDRTKEVPEKDLKATPIEFTDNPKKISECKCIVVTVPTPINEHKMPDLKPIKSATETVGRHVAKGSTIVYESTVYPGLTEEELVPILEKTSKLKWEKDFNVGYSPERVNPGDKEHAIDRIKKVVAGDCKETGDFLAQLYGCVIKAGIHRTSNIKTAEAAKVIENTQRDLNIALMNELSIIFNRMGIDTKEVLNAASTKWNFIRFEPGLVGGHCIGVDPYYLTFKAESTGYHPEVILAGRRINDSMGKYVAENIIKKLTQAGKTIRGSKVLILGLTFKENISDIRNTKVIDLYNELREYGVNVYVYDPCVYKDEVRKEYGIVPMNSADECKPYDAIIVAVKHRQFIEEMGFKKYRELTDGDTPILIDIKGLYDMKKAEKEGFLYWRL
jgi:UDP-N-acetyl-D-galactosamine dehydrogenase